MKRFLLIAAALVLTLPTAAMADGVTFGFNGGALDQTGSNLTTLSGAGAASNLNFVGYFPGGQPNWSGSLGTVNMATGNFLGMCSTGNQSVCFASAGSVLSIVATSAFAPGIVAGTQLLVGTFVDIATAIFPGGPLPPGPYQAGTGAVLSNIPCTSAVPAGTTCYRLYGTIQGTIDPALLAALGLASGTGNGWMAQVDLEFAANQGSILTIRGGDAQLVVPEPASLALFGTGLLGIAGLVRRRLKA